MSSVLLDTNAALWLAEDSPRLGRASRELISSHPTWVSATSLWELEIKRTSSKLTLNYDVRAILAASGIRELALTWEHTTSYPDIALPHRDPFDRMLLAQAQSEGMLFVTADRVIVGTALPFVRDARV